MHTHMVLKAFYNIDSQVHGNIAEGGVSIMDLKLQDGGRTKGNNHKSL